MTGTVKKYITVNLTQEGFHSYANAPEEVAFLRQKHRHLFYVGLTIQVSHNERELEFFMVKSALAGGVKALFDLNLSCEGYAEEILNWATFRYGKDREYVVTVSEDNENGSIVKFNP